jgi:FixJ family two-component response regulator
MPGRDGLDLAGDFRGMSTDMPIAVISANLQQEVVNKAGDVGASFLPKPLTQEALGEFLRDAVARLTAASK